MKNSAIIEMLKTQFHWDENDFIVICHGFYNGEYNYEAKHRNGEEYTLAVRCLETTPFNLYEGIGE